VLLCEMQMCLCDCVYFEANISVKDLSFSFS
jgi:hypothetical protein